MTKRTSQPIPPLPDDLTTLTPPQLMLLAFARDPQFARDVRKTAKKILKYPQAYDQGEWGRPKRRGEVAPCGTVACLAGEFALVRGCKILNRMGRFETPQGGEVFSPEVFQDALAAALGTHYWGLPEDLHTATHRLFGPFGEDWPAPFNTQLDTARTRAARAKVAHDRVLHLLATGE